MIRNLTDSVYWIVNCHEDNGNHIHLSEYLIEDDDGYLLIDPGSGLKRDSIIRDINQITDGSGPDTIITTHSALPHTENVPAFYEEWGDIQTIAAITVNTGLVGLPQAQPRQVNRPLELVGRTVTCIKPLLSDIQASQWVYDHDSRILFTAEAFGHYHIKGECHLTSDEIENGISYGYIEEFYWDKIPFIQYLDLEKLEFAFGSLFDVLDVRYVAPIHGNPIAGENINAYVDDVIRAMDAAKTAEPSYV